MPPIATNMIDPVGVAAVEAWIRKRHRDVPDAGIDAMTDGSMGRYDADVSDVPEVGAPDVSAEASDDARSDETNDAGRDSVPEGAF